MPEGLHRALRRRNVYAEPSPRWADPRALLLKGERRAAVREDVLAGLSLTETAPTHLARCFPFRCSSDPGTARLGGW